MPSARRSRLTPPRVLGPEDLVRTERVDAIVGGAALGLDLAEDLERLAPFGMGNPGVRLLVPSARVRDVRPMGEGKHCRFSLHSGGHRALGVAFGRPSLGVGEEEPVDAAVRLEVNHWNGSVEPRLVLRELYPLETVCRCPGRRVVGAVRAGAAAAARFAAGRATPPGSGRAGRRFAAAAPPPRRSPSSYPAAPRCSPSAPTPRGGQGWPVWPASALTLRRPSASAAAASRSMACVAPLSPTTWRWSGRPASPASSPISSSSIRRHRLVTSASSIVRSTDGQEGRAIRGTSTRRGRRSR